MSFFYKRKLFYRKVLRMKYLSLIVCLIYGSCLVAQGTYQTEELTDTLKRISLSEKLDTPNIDTSYQAPLAEYNPEYLEINGDVYPVLITENDTMILANIEDISISSPRTFSSAEDYKRYRKYKAYAAKVYPYAKSAIRIFREYEYNAQHMNKRKQKKYIKKLQEELKVEFEEPLRNLSKTQGKILVKMIERELDTPMYTLIKNLRGGFRAFYWERFSRLYGYRLKTGYIDGENPILDAVLQDLDISYEIEE